MQITDLQEELYNSIKQKNKNKKNVIADIISIAKNIAIEKHCKDNITEDIVNQAILKAYKMCNEQIDTCPIDRDDLLTNYKSNLQYILCFMPKQLSENEIKDLIQKTLDNMPIKTKNLLMKNIMPQLKGKADSKTINKIATELLGGR